MYYLTYFFKEWYLKFVREECFTIRSSPLECAYLLSQLKYEDIISLMSSKVRSYYYYFLKFNSVLRITFQKRRNIFCYLTSTKILNPAHLNLFFFFFCLSWQWWAAFCALENFKYYFDHFTIDPIVMGV